MPQINGARPKAYFEGISYESPERDGEMIDDFNWRFLNPPTKSVQTIHDFNIFHTLGEGAFGRVVLAETKFHQKRPKQIALKIMEKKKLIHQAQVFPVITEKRILYSAKHPFIVRFELSFKDNSNVYIGLQLLQYGDLSRYLMIKRRLKENTAKFVIAQIIMALEYIHAMDIIHRDIKPNNIMLDNGGYVKLCDFGISKRTAVSASTFCGTAGFMAPEILEGAEYGKGVDWWSLGIVLYELLKGKSPYDTSNIKNAMKKIEKTELVFSDKFTEPSKDLIKGLLQKDPRNRLGVREGSTSIKSQKWFENYDFGALFRHKIPSPLREFKQKMVGEPVHEKPIVISKRNFKPKVFKEF